MATNNQTTSMEGETKTMALPSINNTEMPSSTNPDPSKGQETIEKPGTLRQRALRAKRKQLLETGTPEHQAKIRKQDKNTKKRRWRHNKTICLQQLVMTTDKEEAVATKK